MKDIGYIKNLDIIQRLFKNKSNKDIERLLISIANKEAIAIKNKSS